MSTLEKMSSLKFGVEKAIEQNVTINETSNQQDFTVSVVKTSARFNISRLRTDELISSGQRIS